MTSFPPFWKSGIPPRCSDQASTTDTTIIELLQGVDESHVQASSLGLDKGPLMMTRAR